MNKIDVIGIGPGEYEQMTIKAIQAMKDCDVIIGYTVYVDLVKQHFSDKEFITTPMRQEVKRCKLAFSQAAEGKKVAFICSGDAGVYGMSGLILELQQDYPETEVNIIPGVTAAVGGAAVLGAPLIHDFAVISLSDLLTPWETIRERLIGAAEADFVICLYNPSSQKRQDYLKRACELILTCRRGETICGTAVNIGREGEKAEVCTLAELAEKKADMFTTVFIGNSQTRKLNGRMVTPRGYVL